jgi:hypothetical protein
MKAKDEGGENSEIKKMIEQLMDSKIISGHQSYFFNDHYLQRISRCHDDVKNPENLPKEKRKISNKNNCECYNLFEYLGISVGARGRVEFGMFTGTALNYASGFCSALLKCREWIFVQIGETMTNGLCDGIGKSFYRNLAEYAGYHVKGIRHFKGKIKFDNDE